MEGGRLDFLERFVTSTRENVYAIVNLPEEVVAVIFAYVSRSPESFRDNLQKLLRGDELALGDWLAQAGAPAVREAAAAARAFHERWVVGYGHASVAEHATVHLGIERISRLASAALELANPFLSFTEYSQRYQEPRRGGYHRPELPAAERALYDAAMDGLYDDYLRIQERIVAHLDRSEPRTDETEARRLRRLRRISFEDARYALPLATETNLGLTGNARALRDAIVVLLSSPHREDVALGEAMRRAAAQVVPTLLRHADPSPMLAARPQAARPAPGDAAQVELLDAGEPLPTLRRMAQAVRPGEDLDGLGEAELSGILRSVVPYGPFDAPPSAYRFARYAVRFHLSEAGWHQLLRHRRAMEFSWAEPGMDGGAVVPPLVREAGAEGDLLRAVERAQEAAERLGADHPASRYLVLNAHRRPVMATFDLAEACHFIRQRGKADAQWEIRQAAHALHRLVSARHPFAWLPSAEGGA